MGGEEAGRCGCGWTMGSRRARKRLNEGLLLEQKGEEVEADACCMGMCRRRDRSSRREGMEIWVQVKDGTE